MSALIEVRSKIWLTGEAPASIAVECHHGMADIRIQLMNFNTAHRGLQEALLVRLIWSREEAKVLTATSEINLPLDIHHVVDHHLHPLILGALPCWRAARTISKLSTYVTSWRLKLRNASYISSVWSRPSMKKG